MRILWIGQESDSGDAGDQIYDRKTIAACREKGFEIVRFHPKKAPLSVELGNLARGIPYYRARFELQSNYDELAKLSASADIAICSWESFDRLAAKLTIPTIPILHNITSTFMRSAYPRNPIAFAAARRAARWESEVYNSPHFAALVTLSNADQAYVKSVAPGKEVIRASPGMPPCVPLRNEAQVVPEILILGSYGWYPKRRDVRLFARRYTKRYAKRTDGLKIVADGLPPLIRAELRAAPVAHEALAEGIRFGLVTDRFVAGHKLKIGSYIAQNAIVMSFVDLIDDFADVNGSDEFIVRINDESDITGVVEMFVSKDQTKLRRRFEDFKLRCAERLSWKSNASALLSVARSALGGPSSQRC